MGVINWYVAQTWSQQSHVATIWRNTRPAFCLLPAVCNFLFLHFRVPAAAILPHTHPPTTFSPSSDRCFCLVHVEPFGDYFLFYFEEHLSQCCKHDQKVWAVGLLKDLIHHDWTYRSSVVESSVSAIVSATCTSKISWLALAFFSFFGIILYYFTALMCIHWWWGYVIKCPGTSSWFGSEQLKVLYNYLKQSVADTVCCERGFLCSGNRPWDSPHARENFFVLFCPPTHYTLYSSFCLFVLYTFICMTEFRVATHRDGSCLQCLISKVHSHRHTYVKKWFEKEKKKTTNWGLLASAPLYHRIQLLFCS